MELLAIVASNQFLSSILSWDWKSYSLSNGCDVILLQQTMRAVKMLASGTYLQYICEIASQTVRASRFLDFLKKRLLPRCRRSYTLLKWLLVKCVRDGNLLFFIILDRILLFRHRLLLFETTLRIHSFCVCVRVKYGIFEILSGCLG